MHAVWPYGGKNDNPVFRGLSHPVVMGILHPLKGWFLARAEQPA